MEKIVDFNSCSVRDTQYQSLLMLGGFLWLNVCIREYLDI